MPLCIRSGLWRRWWSILLSNGPQRPSRLRSNHHHRSVCKHADLWLSFYTKAQKVIRQAFFGQFVLHEADEIVGLGTRFAGYRMHTSFF